MWPHTHEHLQSFLFQLRGTHDMISTLATVTIALFHNGLHKNLLWFTESRSLRYFCNADFINDIRQYFHADCISHIKDQTFISLSIRVITCLRQLHVSCKTQLSLALLAIKVPSHSVQQSPVPYLLFYCHKLLLQPHSPIPFTL